LKDSDGKYFYLLLPESACSKKNIYVISTL